MPDLPGGCICDGFAEQDSLCNKARNITRKLCNPLLFVILAWFIHCYAIKDYPSLLKREFSCTDRDNVVTFQYTRLVRKLEYASPVVQNDLEKLSPHVLQWKGHVLIAFLEDVRPPPPAQHGTPAASSDKVRVIRLLQNVTNVEAQRIRDIVKSGKSMQWKTLRIIRLDGKQMQGPVHLSETPDGNGVVLMSEFVEDSLERGTLVSISEDVNLMQWTDHTHRHPPSVSSVTTLKLAKLAMTDTHTIRVSRMMQSVNNSMVDTILVQSYKDKQALLSGKAHQCPTCVEYCDDAKNYTFAKFVLSLKDFDIKQLTMSSTVNRVGLNLFLLDSKGRLAKIKLSEYTSCNSTSVSVHESALLPGMSQSNKFDNFRLISFNSKLFSSKTPNFSIFSAVSDYTRFDTLHTGTLQAKQIVALKLDSHSAITSCSPILMHMGTISGLHTTQLAEDTVVMVYIRQYQGISTVHVAGLFVGDAHVAH